MDTADAMLPSAHSGHDPHLERLTALTAGAAEAESGHSFWIDQQPGLYLLLAGHIDVFAVARRDHQAVGARHHVFRLGPGCLLPAIARNAEGAPGFLAVPTPGSRYRQLLPGLPLADDPLWTEALARFVHAVIEGSVRSLPPRHYQPVLAGQQGESAAGSVLSSVEPLIGLQIESGTLDLFGRPECRFEAGAWLPLTQRSWASVQQPVRWRSLDADSSPATAVTGAALGQWLDRLYAMMAADIANDGQKEAERLTRKADTAAAVMHDALQRFAKVGADDTAHRTAPPLPEPADAAADDNLASLLLRACRAIGAVAGIEFVAPARPAIRAENRSQRSPLATDAPSPPPDDPTQELLAAIVLASRVRHRRVALRGPWWTTDSGPLLAFRQADSEAASKSPLALLRRRGDAHYHALDPATGQEQILTSELAATLEPFAWSFYRTLPARVLSLGDLLRFGSRGQGADLVRILLPGALIGLLAMVMPLATGHLVDSVIPAADPHDLIALMGIVLATVIASALFALARSISVLRLEGRMDGAIQAAVWDRVLALPTRFFRGYAAGDLALRINGINTMRRALSGAVIASLLGGVFSIFNIGLLFRYHAGLALLALGLMVLALMVSGSTAYLRLRHERRISEISGKISGMVFQYLNGIVKLRVCAAEGRAFASWAGEYTRLQQLGLKAARISAVEETFYAGYSIATHAAIFAVVGLLLFRDASAGLGTGPFIVFHAAFGSVFAALMELSRTGLGLLNLVPVYERTRPILEALPEVDASKTLPGELSGDIEVVKLGFGYDGGAEVLHDISFRARPGEFIAIVGPSGSGKSTLLRLLMGFEKPVAGSVYYDSQDLFDLDLHAVRRQLGVVLQSGQLMTGDIFANIAGATAATLDEVWQAARLCGLEDDINQMPMGLHTVISEGSSTLSGGQRQRILIARALVNKPRIVFFDEATSALDNRTQAIVAESLERLKATRIVIAHRLSTIIHADRILVLQDGRLMQSGSYEELIHQPGLFAELAKRQTA